MTEPAQDIAHRVRRVAFGHTRPFNHDDGQPERSRSVELGACACAASVLGDDVSDPMCSQHSLIRLRREGAAGKDDVDIRQRQRRRGCVDDAQQIEVLGLGRERREALPSDREKHARGLPRQRSDSSVDIGDATPVVTRLGLPLGPLEGDQWRSRRGAGVHRVAAHLRCERMCGVDDVRDLFVPKGGDEAVDTAEAADARGHRLAFGRRGAARIGVEARDTGSGERTREVSSFGRAAQEKDADHG